VYAGLAGAVDNARTPSFVLRVGISGEICDLENLVCQNHEMREKWLRVDGEVGIVTIDLRVLEVKKACIEYSFRSARLGFEDWDLVRVQDDLVNALEKCCRK